MSEKHSIRQNLNLIFKKIKSQYDLTLVDISLMLNNDIECCQTSEEKTKFVWVIIIYRVDNKNSKMQ